MWWMTCDMFLNPDLSRARIVVEEQAMSGRTVKLKEAWPSGVSCNNSARVLLGCILSTTTLISL